MVTVIKTCEGLEFESSEHVGLLRDNCLWSLITIAAHQRSPLGLLVADYCHRSCLSFLPID